MHIRVYKMYSMRKVEDFEAHSDYIRCVAVHPVCTIPADIIG